MLYFDRKPAQEKPWTDKLWIYDLRTNKHFTLKENPLKRSIPSNMPGFPRHTRRLGASRRKARPGER